MLPCRCLWIINPHMYVIAAVEWDLVECVLWLLFDGVSAFSLQFLTAPQHGATVSANEVQLQLNETIFMSRYSAWLDSWEVWRPTSTPRRSFRGPQPSAGRSPAVPPAREAQARPDTAVSGAEQRGPARAPRRARVADALPGNEAAAPAPRSAAGAGARVARRRRCRARRCSARLRSALSGSSVSCSAGGQAGRQGRAGEARRGVSRPAGYGTARDAVRARLGPAALRPPALRGRSGPGELSGLRGCLKHPGAVWRYCRDFALFWGLSCCVCVSLQACWCGNTNLRKSKGGGSNVCKEASCVANTCPPQGGRALGLFIL